MCASHAVKAPDDVDSPFLLASLRFQLICISNKKDEIMAKRITIKRLHCWSAAALTLGARKGVGQHVRARHRPKWINDL
jgi:hypothetical protein